MWKFCGNCVENRSGKLFPWSIQKTEVGYRFIYYLRSLEYFPLFGEGAGATPTYLATPTLDCHAHNCFSLILRIFSLLNTSSHRIYAKHDIDI